MSVRVGKVVWVPKVSSEIECCDVAVLGAMSQIRFDDSDKCYCRYVM